MQIHPLLDDNEPFFNQRRRDADAEPQAGREDFRQRGDIDHMLRRERPDGGHVLAAIAQRAIRIIFNQQGVMALNNLRDLLASRQCDASAGRILKGRDSIDKFDGMRFQCLIERFRHKPVFVHIHADVLRLIRIKRLKRTEIRRRFHRDFVAGRNQRFAERVQDAL